MKKHYEDFRKIIFLFFILVLLILMFSVFICNSKISIYKMFNGVVFNEEHVLFMLGDDELKLFQKNKIIFIENKKIKFSIWKIDENIVEKEKVKYHQVYIKVDISNMYKVGDILSISIKEKNVKSYEIFKIIWKGGYNEESK